LIFLLSSESNKKAELLQRWPRDAPYIRCPENFQESVNTPTATYAKIFNGLLFWLILRMSVQNLKFVALPIPEIIRGTPKIWTGPGYAHAPFSPKFWMCFKLLLFRWTLWIYQPNLKSIALPVPEIISRLKFCGLRTPIGGGPEGVANPQSWGRRGRKGSALVPFKRALVSS